MIRRLCLKVTICGIILFAPSCEKYLVENDPENTPITNFNFLWTEVNNKYSYFEYKNIDWDSIYDLYRVSIHEDMNDTALFTVLADMLYELNDGHVNLRSSFDRSRNWSWFLDYPQNFNETIVSRNYLGTDHWITGPLKNQLIDSVLYIYYSSFGSDISEAHVDHIVERAKGLKGLIIDVRNNGGGSLRNGVTLASGLTSEAFEYAKTRIKTGPGPEDYAPWNTQKITPREGEKYTGKIVLLCNRYSYSASNFFAQIMKSHPNAILMGDQTGGGGGVPAYGELPNGWIYRFSATQTINLQGEHIEGGVAVDTKVDLDPQDEANGVDTIIEAALAYLNNAL